MRQKTKVLIQSIVMRIGFMNHFHFSQLPSVYVILVETAMVVMRLTVAGHTIDFEELVFHLRATVLKL